MAYQGIDLRDLWRRESGLTPRRLDVLVRCLPADAPLWSALRAAVEQAEVEAFPAKYREREEFYKRRAQGAGNGTA